MHLYHDRRWLKRQTKNLKCERERERWNAIRNGRYVGEEWTKDTNREQKKNKQTNKKNEAKNAKEKERLRNNKLEYCDNNDLII